jgi:alpha-L-fucosidase
MFTSYPIGWMRFDKPGKHTVSVRLIEGDPISSELASIKFTPIDFGE